MSEGNGPGGGVPRGSGQGQAGRNAILLSEFSSRDLDETRAHVNRYGDHSRVVHGHDAFLYGERSAATGRVTIGWWQRSFRQTLRAAVRSPTLFLNEHCGDTVRYGRRKRFEFGPSRALISVPGQEYRVQGAAGSGIALLVAPELLESALDARSLGGGRSRRWMLQSVAAPMTQERREELGAMFDLLMVAAAPDGTWGPYGGIDGFERAAAEWMADLLLEASGVQPASDWTLQRMSRLQRWIDANLADDITLDGLCAVAGLSWRSLQKAMLAAHGQTPLEFVHARRLAAARKRLEAGAARARISTIAFDCGFRHLGRFAASYRAAFGELPSDTARARRAGC